MNNEIILFSFLLNKNCLNFILFLFTKLTAIADQSAPTICNILQCSLIPNMRLSKDGKNSKLYK